MTTPRQTSTTRRAWTTIAAVVVLTALACAASAEIHQVVLDNGLTLVVLPNPWTQAVALSVMVGAGSKYDPTGLEGLAQLTNEFFFEGIGDRPWDEVYDDLSSQGVEFKCLTSEDTAEIILTGHKARFDYMVDMVSASLTGPVLTEERLEYEKKVALSSYESEVADSWNGSYRALTALLYDGHPYMHTPLGTPEGMAAVEVEDIAGFYKQFYSPANTIVVAVGDLVPESTFARFEEVFVSYTNPADPPAAVPVPERTSMTMSRQFGAEDNGYLQIGFAGPTPAETGDLAAIRVLMAVLGAGKDSRLYRMLTESEEETVSATGAFASHRAEQVRLIVYALGVSDTGTLERILGEVERIKTDPPSADEVARAKEDVIGGFVLRMQRNAEKASTIARDHFLGLPLGCCETYIEDTEAVTADEVRAVAERYFVNPAVAVKRPGAPPKKRGI